jgi:hypothetical protein
LNHFTDDTRFAWILHTHTFSREVFLDDRHSVEMDSSGWKLRVMLHDERTHQPHLLWTSNNVHETPHRPFWWREADGAPRLSVVVSVGLYVHKRLTWDPWSGSTDPIRSDFCELRKMRCSMDEVTRVYLIQVGKDTHLVNKYIDAQPRFVSDADNPSQVWDTQTGLPIREKSGSSCWFVDSNGLQVWIPQIESTPANLVSRSIATLANQLVGLPLELQAELGRELQRRAFPIVARSISSNRV